MDDFNDLTFTKFSVGQSVSRFEDPELLRDEGLQTAFFFLDISILSTIKMTKNNRTLLNIVIK